MSNTILYIQRHESYSLSFVGADKTISIKGDDLLDSIEGKYNRKHSDSLLKQELKQLNIALSRAIEEGDSLKIGIVLGQTVSKLEELINK